MKRANPKEKRTEVYGSDSEVNDKSEERKICKRIFRRVESSETSEPEEKKGLKFTAATAK